MPATIAITIIAAALTETPRVSCAWIATRTRRSRNAGTTPTPALTTISPSSIESRRQYGLKSFPIRRRFARRTSGSVGRSGGASPRSWKNIPIRPTTNSESRSIPPSRRLHLVDPERARELLQAERTRIERALGQAAHQDDGEPADEIDPGNLASDLYQDELDEGLRDDLEAQLAAVERAEARLAAGTYGLSVRSGEPIPDERLEVRPTAELTVDEERAS